MSSTFTTATRTKERYHYLAFKAGDLSPMTISNLAAHLLRFISHASVEQYKTALEHISVRAGTAIPTGAAEGALAALYQRREEAWPFLAKYLTADDVTQKEEEASPKCDVQANGTEDRKGGVDGEGERAVAYEPDVATTTTTTTDKPEEKPEDSDTGQHQQRTLRARGNKPSGSTTSSAEAVSESFSLIRLSTALEAFARACEDRGCALEGLAVQDLVDFLYLGGQAKASSQCFGEFGCGSILRMRNY